MLQPLNRQITHSENRFPERIVQFGGGNFLRGFVDWIVEELNTQTKFASSVVVVKLTPHGSYDELDAQDGLFHVRLTRSAAGQPVTETSLITCVSRSLNPYQHYESYLNLARQPEIRFIVSNSTESGLVFDPAARLADQPSDSFPAKLAAFLYERYRYFDGDTAYGCIVLPCELIERNGELLKAMMIKYVELWELPQGFSVWMESCCTFCNTLVDRIVSGFPQNDSAAIFRSIGFQDKLLVDSEWYHRWVIEAPEWLERELPFHETKLNVKIVDDIRPYYMLKVRILNGAHTSMVAAGLFLELETVRQAIEHPLLGRFIRDLVFDEIVPVLGMPDAIPFAEAVLDRFHNPFIQHQLTSIVQNSLSKMKSRLLPTILAYRESGKLPERLVFAFTALIRFYSGDWHGRKMPVNDDPILVSQLRQLWSSGISPSEFTARVLSDVTLWGIDLTEIPLLTERVSSVLTRMETESIESLLRDWMHDR